MKTREHNFHKEVADVAARVEEVKALTCEWCFQSVNSVVALQRHQRNGCKRARGRVKQTSSVSNADPEPECAAVSAGSVSASDLSRGPNLTMGYAWIALRDHVTETIGARARLILEQSFQRGVVKGGDRQSCFQMVSYIPSSSPSNTIP